MARKACTITLPYHYQNYYYAYICVLSGSVSFLAYIRCVIITSLQYRDIGIGRVH